MLCKQWAISHFSRSIYYIGLCITRAPQKARYVHGEVRDVSTANKTAALTAQIHCVNTSQTKTSKSSLDLLVSCYYASVLHARTASCYPIAVFILLSLMGGLRGTLKSCKPDIPKNHHNETQTFSRQILQHRVKFRRFLNVRCPQEHLDECARNKWSHTFS